jgi:nitroimidazol reductase NimA-like FMN-containing flavoprotein (pyridoxamine 5'-phosphate oxidase superfamily)
VIAVPFDESVQVLNEDQCLALLRSHNVGRIAFGFEGRIEIFPVNYGIEGVVIVIRTSPGTKLEGAPKSAVAFEVDGWDAESGIGWSVVARGFAAEVTTDSGRVAEHLRAVPVRPVAPGEHFHVLAIKPTEITGRQFHAPPARPERL